MLNQIIKIAELLQMNTVVDNELIIVRPGVRYYVSNDNFSAKTSHNIHRCNFCLYFTKYSSTFTRAYIVKDAKLVMACVCNICSQLVQRYKRAKSYEHQWSYKMIRGNIMQILGDPLYERIVGIENKLYTIVRRLCNMKFIIMRETNHDVYLLILYWRTKIELFS